MGKRKVCDGEETSVRWVRVCEGSEKDVGWVTEECAMGKSTVGVE